MMDWTTNQPNARFWSLKLLKDSFQPGDTLVATSLRAPLASDVEAQAFATATDRKLLLINKRDRPIDIAIPDAGHAQVLTVDEQSGENPARSVSPQGGILTLQPFAVTVVRWKSGA